MPTPHAASDALRNRLMTRRTFQISVDTDNLAQGLAVAEAAEAAGITIIEMGTPLLKFEGVLNVVPAFRRKFPQALLLADMKTMDGGGGEADAVFRSGANIIDFLALAGVASAKNAVAARDDYRRRDPDMPRLCFADILLPQQGPAQTAIDTARRMIDAGVDGVGIHLQADARAADLSLYETSYFPDMAEALFEAVGDRASVQVVGGLSIARAQRLAQKGLCAFVISGNLGAPDLAARYHLPAGEITGMIRDFIAAVEN